MSRKSRITAHGYKYRATKIDDCWVYRFVSRNLPCESVHGTDTYDVDEDLCKC